MPDTRTEPHHRSASRPHRHVRPTGSSVISCRTSSGSVYGESRRFNWVRSPDATVSLTSPTWVGIVAARSDGANEPSGDAAMLPPLGVMLDGGTA